MRVIWWKITRPDLQTNTPGESWGDNLNIHLPEDWSPLQLNSEGDNDIDREWLNRLLKWTDGHDGSPEPR